MTRLTNEIRTDICRAAVQREDRVALFQACVYGNEDPFLINQYNTVIDFLS